MGQLRPRKVVRCCSCSEHEKERMESEMNRKLLLWILGLSGLCLLGCAGLMVGIWGVLTMSTGGEGGGNRQVVLNALPMASNLNDGERKGNDVSWTAGFPRAHSPIGIACAVL